jgi:hypothetical protein
MSLELSYFVVQMMVSFGDFTVCYNEGDWIRLAECCTDIKEKSLAGTSEVVWRITAAVGGKML